MTAREYDLIVIGAGTVGENVADYAKKGGLTRRAGRGRAGRRRVLVLGVHAVEGAAARRERPARGARRRGRVAGGDRRRGSRGGVRAPHQDRPRLGRRIAGRVGRLDRDRPGPRPRPAHRRARRRRWRPPTARRSTCARSTPSTVSTGSVALLPDIPGLAEIEPWTSHDATSATAAPASLAILGGGVVACEMATAYASFGTKVTHDRARRDAAGGPGAVRGRGGRRRPRRGRRHDPDGRRGRRGSPHREQRGARAERRRQGRRRAGAGRDRPQRRAPWTSGSRRSG